MQPDTHKMQNQTPTILPVATVIHADWQVLHFRAENADEVKHSDTGVYMAYDCLGTWFLIYVA